MPFNASQHSLSWTDMSDFVVHFAKDYEGKNAYFNMLGILHSRTVLAKNPFGIGKSKAPDIESQKVVCFSEIPLYLLKRLADARSPYGIVFKKNFMLQRGANPIFYAYKGHELTSALNIIMADAKAEKHHPIWKIAPYIDAPGDYGKPYFFEWEREWRMTGNFSFDVEDVAFLIIPDELHEAARGFFDNAEIENTGPCYKCPFIDPYWSREKVEPLLLGKI